MPTSTETLVAKYTSEAKTKSLQDLRKVMGCMSGLVGTDHFPYEQEIRLACYASVYINYGGDIKDLNRYETVIETHNRIIGEEIELPKEIGTDKQPPMPSFESMVCRKFLRLEERSAEKGLEFDLTISDIKRMMKRKTCEYTGEPITCFAAVGSLNGLTFDRKDPNKGYTKENVKVVSYWANKVKNDLFEHPDRSNGLDFSDIDRLISLLQSIK